MIIEPTYYYFASVTVAKYLDQRVCLSVCLCTRLSQQKPQLSQRDRATRYMSVEILSTVNCCALSAVREISFEQACNR